LHPRPRGSIFEVTDDNSVVSIAGNVVAAGVKPSKTVSIAWHSFPHRLL
jgi:hypothetical protein